MKFYHGIVSITNEGRFFSRNGIKIRPIFKNNAVSVLFALVCKQMPNLSALYGLANEIRGAVHNTKIQQSKANIIIKTI